jgi:predicted transglutaminase-like cysteine proteinase
MSLRARKIAGGIVLPLMTAFGGCASTGAVPTPELRSSTASVSAPQAKDEVRYAFNYTVNAFHKMGFSEETGLGPYGHRNLCLITFNNGYKPCADVKDPSIRAMVPYGSKSRNGVDGIVNEDLIRTINAEVNAAILPVSDTDKYGGITENWSLGRPHGSAETGYIPAMDALTPGSLEDDCDGYAYLKQYTLRQHQIASHVTVVRDAKDQTHLVLMVLTDQGPVILDNLAPEPKLWKDTVYARKGHTLQVLNFWEPDIYGWHTYLD